MKDDLREVVKVFYGDSSLFGYLEITSDNSFLSIRTEDKNLIEEFENYSEKNFTFHCKKLSGNFVSLFDCFLLRIGNANSDDPEFTFVPRIYIDNFLETEINHIDDFKISTLSAYYFNLGFLFENLKKDENVSGIFSYENEDVIFKLKLVNDTKSNLFETIERKKVVVTFRIKEEKDFD